MHIDVQNQIFDRLVRDAELARTEYETGLTSYGAFENRIEFIRDTGFRLYQCAIFDRDISIDLTAVLKHIKYTVDCDRSKKMHLKFIEDFEGVINDWNNRL